MKTPPLPILVGLLAGLCLGGSVRYLAIERDSTAGDFSQKPNGEIATASAQPSEELPHLPRPSFEEVLQLHGMDDAAVLARFLEEATMEEVLALMEAVSSSDAKINDLRWMIEVRGLELDPHALIAWMKNGGRGSGVDRHGLYQRWAVIDPRSALVASLEEAPVVRQDVILRMQGGDLDEGIAILKEVLPDSSELKEFESLRRAKLAKDNPRAALTEVLAVKEGSDRTRNLVAVVDAWATKDPLAAVAWLEDQDDFHGAKGMMETALGKLAEKDPRLARSKIEALPESILKSKLEGIAIKELANLDRAEALNWAKELPPGSKRDFLFASMAAAWEDEPGELLRLVQELEIDVLRENATVGIDYRTTATARPGRIWPRPPAFEDPVNRAALELAKKSPEEALLALHSLNLIRLERWSWPSDGPQTTTQEIAAMWVSKDPEAAANWAAGLVGSDLTSTIQNAVFEAWASNAPEDTAAFVTANALTDHEALSLAIASQWASQDADAAVEWATQLDDRVKQNVLVWTLNELAMTDPVQALNHLDVLDRETSKDVVLRQSIRTWSGSDPEGLVTWLFDQPNGERMDMVPLAFENWVLNQPQAASEWVVQMDEGPQKDKAAAGIVRGLIDFLNPSKDFAAAEEWAHAIADPVIRQHSLDKITRTLEQGH